MAFQSVDGLLMQENRSSTEREDVEVSKRNGVNMMVCIDNGGDCSQDECDR